MESLHRHARCFALFLILGGAALGLPPVSSADPPIQDAAVSAGEDLDPNQPLVALPPYLHLLAARERQHAGDLEGARAELARARELDPGLIEPLLATTWLDLGRSPNAGAEGFLAVQEVARARFSWQAPAVIGGIWGLIAVLIVALTVLTAVYASQAAGPIHHLLTEHLKRSIDPRLAAPAAAVLLGLPLIWGAGPLGAALILLILAGPGRGAGNRFLIAAGSSAIILLGLAPRFAPDFLRPPDYNDQAQILDLAEHAPLTPALAARLEEMSGEGAELALLVHGNALRRAGQSEAAEPLFARFAAARPDDPRGPLALGNCRFTAGDPEGAVSFYRKATVLDPNLAAPFVNLAAAYSVLLQFELANAALADAARIDPRAVAAMNAAGSAATSDAARGAIGSLSPLELGTHPRELWTLFLRERSERGVNPPGYITAWLPWHGRGAWPLAFLIMVAASFLRRPLARTLTTFACSGCGRPVCRRCVTRRHGLALCHRCHARVSGLPTHDAGERLVAAERRWRRAANFWPRLIWNLLLPGHGLIEARRHVWAAVWVGALAFAWIGYQTGGHPIMPLAPVPVVDWLLSGRDVFGLAFLAIFALTAGLGITTRPVLGMKKRGRLTPLKPAGGGQSTDPYTPFRTGTHG
jgi:tetratricopeptide (TPR) repeat protein